MKRYRVIHQESDADFIVIDPTELELERLYSDNCDVTEI